MGLLSPMTGDIRGCPAGTWPPEQGIIGGMSAELPTKAKRKRKSWSGYVTVSQCWVAAGGGTMSGTFREKEAKRKK